MARHKIALVGLMAPLLLLALGCGGSGGGGGDTNTGGVVYTPPSTNGAVPVIQENAALSTSSILVFDVIGEEPSQMVRGVSLNLQVDATKLIPAEVPGTREAEPVHLLPTPTATPGGFGDGNAVAVRKDMADGTATMGDAIQNPAAAVACQGVLLRFAYQVVGSPVMGVIRAQVMSGSGLMDADGHFISGTAPVIGQLAIE